MTREEFLQELRIALQGRIPQSQVNEHLKYYKNYIMEESRKGRTEEEVIADIGNPRLAAKTLTDLYGEEKYQNIDYGKAGEKKESSRKKFSFHSGFRRILTGLAAVIFLILLVKIGIVLLPILAAAVLTGGICYVIYLIFFGNKK